MTHHEHTNDLIHGKTDDSLGLRRISVDFNGAKANLNPLPYTTLKPGFKPVSMVSEQEQELQEVIKLDIVPEPERAHTFLEEGAKQMAARAQLRDQPKGERSMANIVKTFNALAGKDLTEAEGWEFMILLKMVRGRQGKYNRDDYVDGAAYFGLLGECESGAGRG